MSAIGTEKFAENLENLLSAIAADSSIALSPTPGRTILVAPGEVVAHDDCCDGQVWARLVTLAPTPTTNPAGRPGLHPCALPHFVATIELGVIRCAAVVNSNGKAPSPRQITADGQQGLADMSTLLGVLRCTPNLRGLQAWTPVGPEGGCHGGFWTFTALISNCIGCEENG